MVCCSLELLIYSVGDLTISMQCLERGGGAARFGFGAGRSIIAHLGGGWRRLCKQSSAAAIRKHHDVFFPLPSNGQQLSWLAGVAAPAWGSTRRHASVAELSLLVIIRKAQFVKMAFIGCMQDPSRRECTVSG